jgi:hypothetical protein
MKSEVTGLLGDVMLLIIISDFQKAILSDLKLKDFIFREIIL